MKKNGFTLAEVLVTLGIIGVISAITLPSLLSNTTDAQIGPKLAKAASAFEQANEALLNAESVDTLSDARLLTSAGTYIDALSRHMKINPRDDQVSFTSKDGFLYSINITDPNPANPQLPAYRQRIGNVVIDINVANGQTINATDTFYFSFWNDGSLRPQGGTNWIESRLAANTHWSVECPIGAVPTNTRACAGHIFENNLKVLYK